MKHIVLSNGTLAVPCTMKKRNFMTHLLYLFRGDRFRVDFARLGEVRSLIPPHVHILALTATATKATRKIVMKRLSMKSSEIVSVTPDKPNLIYLVQDKPNTIEDAVSPLIEKLRLHQLPSNHKIIIFCRTYDECSKMYRLFKLFLGINFTEPVGAPDLARFRTVDMFCKCTEVSVKECIVSSFCNPSSPLRVVIATIAFGMGLDSPCVRQTIHWSPSSQLEDYVQETGRSGRDGELSPAALYFTKADQQNAGKCMMDYCRNTSDCRRKLLFEGFDGSNQLTPPCSKCTCCDICAKQCDCGKCNDKISHFVLL